MAIIPGTNSKPGFHASDHTYPEIIVYQHIDDPVVVASAPLLGFPLDGRTGLDDQPSITSVTTHKDIGSASGNFQITMKASQAADTLFKKLVDDDWIDISFYKHDDPYHVMRGLIDELRRSRNVSGTGATTETFTIAGRDFGKIWESTPIWFSPFANDVVSEAVSTEIFKAVPGMYTSPGQAPLVFLKDFMEEMTARGGVNWEPPLNMPGINKLTFSGNVDFQEAIPGTNVSKYFQNIPMRKQFNTNAMNPQGMAWDLAREYSDPSYTEMYVDVLPGGDPFSPRLTLGDPVSPLETKMAVVLRDKPFPVLPSSAPLGYVATWDLLPFHLLTRQEIVNDDVGRSGFERYNAFFVAPRFLQELAAAHSLYMQAPLLDNSSIGKHGLRRMDVQTNVESDPLNPVPWGGINPRELIRYQRQIIRDWYCMNPYLLSGTITTGHGRPDIKIGNKLLIKGTGLTNPLDYEPDELYYVESVDQHWQAGIGLRTTIGVTRGWVGTSIEYMASLAKVAARHQLPPMTLAVP